MENLSESENTELLSDHQCPDCHTKRFFRGPEGGLSVNIKCKNCGSEFNVCPPIFAERISVKSPDLKFTLVGHISSGDAVYWQKGGALAVEKDKQHLVEPTPEEREEICKTMLHLRLVKETSDAKIKQIESEEAEEARL